MGMSEFFSATTDAFLPYLIEGETIIRMGAKNTTELCINEVCFNRYYKHLKTFVLIHVVLYST